MDQSVDEPSSALSTAESERVRLTRLALTAALRVPGVLGSDTGPGKLFVTVGDGERLQGIVCAAAKPGGYEVGLRLVCGMVPLPQLAEQVKAAVRVAAARATIDIVSVDVTVADVVTATEVANLVHTAGG